ncbi:MAG: helix-hairpin-helix domain-containing protein [Candidatus Lokiarchaeota archaeon]|nr:helix-hairpin-helix domain-containing protein [Candidatus Lokiarchaeota archaeon]
MTNVFENSQKLVVKNVKDKSVFSPQVSEDLTRLKGIGPGTAQKLYSANIYTFKQLADISLDKLSEILGIKIMTAHKFIMGAKNHLYKFPDQNSFIRQNQLTEKTTEMVKNEKETEVSNSETLEVAEVIVEEELPQEEYDGEEETIETTQKRWFDDKFNYSRLTASYPPISERFPKESNIKVEEIQEQPEEPQEQIDIKFNEESFVDEKPEEEDSREDTTFVSDISEILEAEKIRKMSNIRDEREKIKIEIEESLQKLQYYIIPNTISKLNPFIEKIDYIGCKLVHVSKWVNHIFLIPIEICYLEGAVLVDEVKFDYNSRLDTNKTEVMSRLRLYHKNLVYTRDLMFDDIVNGSKFREFFQKYLQVSLTLEKSVENKKLYFKSGQTQYKVLIEPIMLCKTPPRCMEKSISFPYQRNTNIHVIHQPDLSQLLSFVEEKYRLIESRVKSPNTIKNYQKTEEKFIKNVRIASTPLVGYAIALAVIYFAEFFYLLRLFNSIGFAIVGIYLSILVYLYFKFFKTKKELAIEFETPYYMQNLEFSEIDLLEFKDQFTPDYLTQFGYECFGKDRNFKVLEQNEKDTILNSVHTKEIKVNSITLPELVEEKGEEDSIQKMEYSNKYLSFLED